MGDTQLLRCATAPYLFIFQKGSLFFLRRNNSWAYAYLTRVFLIFPPLLIYHVTKLAKPSNPLDPRLNTIHSSCSLLSKTVFSSWDKKSKKQEPELTGHEMYLFFFVFAASAYAQFTRERDWGCVITRWYNNTVLSAVFTICRPLNWHLDLRLSLLYSKYFSSFSIRHTFMNRSGFTIYSVFHSLNIITVKKRSPLFIYLYLKRDAFSLCFHFPPWNSQIIQSCFCSPASANKRQL